MTRIEVATQADLDRVLREQPEAMAQRCERLAAQSDEASRYHSRPGGVAWQAEHTRWLAQFYRSEAVAIRAAQGGEK